MRTGAADRSGIRCYRTKFQSQPREYARVAVKHFPICRLQILVAHVKRVSVLHHELTAAHHTKARADFIAEFGLYLVKIQRQLAVAFDFASHHVGNHFLMCRAKTEIALMAVFDAQQLRAILLPAAGFNPQFGRLHGGHRQFNPAAAVHFFADNGFNLAQHAQAQRHPGINPAGEPFNQAGTQHEFVADNFGLGGRLF